MGAYATDFVEKIWPLTYRAPKLKQVRLTRPKAVYDRIARPAGGYLWDRCDGSRRQLPQLRRVGRQRQDAERPRHGRR